MVNMNKFKDPAVYGLHAGDGEIRYVGATRGNSKNRLWEHIYRANSGHNAPVYQWMRNVGVRNVEVVDLEKISNLDDILEVEASWIKRLVDDGASLVNDKGLDGYPFSNGPHMRRSVSDSNQGRSTWIKGKTGLDAGWTPERRLAQSDRFKALREVA